MSRFEALVTGGSGYFGSLLRNRLRESGRTVAVFDLQDADDRPGDVAFFRGDIRNFSQIREAVDQAEVIYHCVAQVPLARDRRLFRSVNIDGAENLLRAPLVARARKVILLSSSAVFGIPDKNPVDETAEPRPVEDYGQAKLEAEMLARRYAGRQGLDVTIIRPRTILGHGRLGIFQILFDWVADGRDIYVLGKGDNIYQFVHADDLADACLRASDHRGFALYHVGAERFCTMRESLEGLVLHAGTGSRVKSLPMKPTVFLMETLSKVRLLPFAPYHWLMYGRSLYFDTTRARQELSWKPKWGNIDMLCQSYDWYLGNRASVMAAGGASAHRSAVKSGFLLLLKWLS